MYDFLQSPLINNQLRERDLLLQLLDSTLVATESLLTQGLDAHSEGALDTAALAAHPFLYLNRFANTCLNAITCHHTDPHWLSV